MTNQEISALLSQFADLLDIKGESGFRVSAYRRGADTVKRLEEPVNTLLQEGRLTDVKGIGKGLAGNISEIVELGRFPDLETIQDEIPETLLTILAIPGVGAKSVGRFYRELGITNVEELEAAVERGEIAGLKGFGKRHEERITEGIAFLRQRTGRVSIGTALPAARELSQALADSLGARAEIAGSVRRRAETVGNIDILVENSSQQSIRTVLDGIDTVSQIERIDDTVFEVTIERLCQVRIVRSAPESWGTDLVWLTGSADHLSQMDFSPASGFEDEESVYANAELAWIPPELREGTGEIDVARKGELPELITLGDIRGDLHLHSNWSDGRATIEQLANRAVQLGYEYLAIADHSFSLAIANGLDRDRIEAQREEIEAVQKTVPGLRLLCASEVELRRDGSLDFSDEVLSQLDVVVASLHSGRNMPQQELTDRLLSAIENPHVDIVAHPMGRIVEQRPPASYDWERVFEAAARTGTALEINANPARLDLDEHLARQAIASGVLLSIDSDAHDLTGLDVMEYGVGIARRGWVESKSVVNTLPIQQLLKWLGR